MNLRHMLIAVTMLSVSSSVYAAASTDEEIQHLLQYIETSQCTFVRNGSAHNSAGAREHIEMKYGHVRSYVNTTEDFIRYAATKSSMSGKKYQVICNDQRHNTGDWLLLELKRFRQGG